MTPRRLAPLLVLSLAGCSSAISTLQSPDVLRPGHVSVTAGIDVAIPVSRIADVLDQASALEDKVKADPGYQPTDEEKQAYLGAALGLALNAPGPITDVMGRVGLGHGFDVGLRYSATGLHGDVKWQFWNQGPDGWRAAVSVGYQYHRFKGLIFDLLEYIDIKDFSRHDLEIPLLVGRAFGEDADGAYPGWSGRVWGGPKLIVAWVSIDAKLDQFDDTLDHDGTMVYVGGVVGGALGYRGIELYLEMTVMHLSAEATILGAERDLGGIVLMPSFGLMTRF
jgi:hypothetical protein